MFVFSLCTWRKNPPRWLEDWGQEVVRDAASGRQQQQETIRCSVLFCDLWTVDSSFKCRLLSALKLWSRSCFLWSVLCCDWKRNDYDCKVQLNVFRGFVRVARPSFSLHCFHDLVMTGEKTRLWCFTSDKEFVYFGLWNRKTTVSTRNTRK